MHQTSEKIILQNLMKGDRSAFRFLFQKYYQPLFLFAQKFVDKEQAKDFVQDCFCELWQNRENIEISVSLSAYLFTIIKNRCYKHLKKEQQKTSRGSNFGLLLKQKELQHYTNSEKSILEFEIKDRIEKVTNHLPEKCREVFKESRHNGLSNKEIAEKHDISVKAVEKHISKALKLFRDEFKDIIAFLFAIILQQF
jgi:RNA polymerase sigma-70 factor (ECF subfamily)